MITRSQPPGADAGPLRFVRYSLLAIMAGAGLATMPHYSGNSFHYVLFNGASILLALSATLPPLSHGFSALVLFLSLGFWVKVVATTIGFNPLIEPIGAFDDSGEGWDRVLMFSAAGLLAVALPKIAWYWRAGAARTEEVRVCIPAWFIAHRRLIWGSTLGVIAVANAVNWVWRFYMVGVHELVLLPLHLNVVIIWWLTVASGMWLALLLGWEHQIRDGKAFGAWLLIPVAEALVTSIIMLSRGFYLMKTLPYALVLAHKSLRRALQIRRSALASLAIIAILGFGLSIFGASWLRLLIHPKLQLTDAADQEPGRARSGRVGSAGAAPSSVVPTSAEVDAVKQQLAKMVFGRWIGLEGVLAVSSYPQLGFDLWSRAAAEDPKVGTAALYQQISQADYEPLQGFTFMTLPGAIAVMSYAGSVWFLFCGMLALATLLLATEDAFRRLFQNEFLCAVTGVAMANTVAQMNFPYLTGVFFIELWGTLVLFWCITRLGGYRTVSVRTPIARASG